MTCSAHKDDGALVWVRNPAISDLGSSKDPRFLLFRRYWPLTPKDNGHVAGFREAVEGWTDERFVTRQQLWAMSMFFLYLVNLSETDGWSYDGHSLKVGAPMCTLTVKAHIEGTPQVVFTSGRTPMGCVRVFIRKLEEDLLEWRPDQYRQ